MVQQFTPICAMERMLGFWHVKHTKLGSFLTGCILASRYDKLLGKNFQGVYFPQFFAKSGAGRAQLGFFGHSRAIEAIYFSF
jgi:hypothetical protein